GASFSARGLSCHAPTRNAAIAQSVKIQAKLSVRAPVANARCAVRGFSLSYRRSAMRLIVIAALRAATMATMIQSSCRQVGQPLLVKRAASNAPVRAKGRANTECSNLIISRTVRRRPCVVAAALMLLLLWPRRSQSSGTFQSGADPFARERDKHIGTRGRRWFWARDRKRESPA